jgi:hypothetical protein
MSVEKDCAISIGCRLQRPKIHKRYRMQEDRLDIWLGAVLNGDY